MKKWVATSIVAFMIVAGMAIFAYQNGYFTIDQVTDSDMTNSSAIQELESQNQTQQKEIAALKAELERLNEQMTSKDIAESEVSATVKEADEVIDVPNSSSASTPSNTQPAISEPVSTTPASQPSPSSTPSQAAQNAGTIFEGYTVTITDKTTPATTSGGLDWPITTYYFFSAGGQKLGSITGKATEAIMNKYKIMEPGGGQWKTPNNTEAWDVWFAEKYNDLRGVSGIKSEGDYDNSDDDAPSLDHNTMCDEAFSLVNSERLKAGLSEVSVDSDLMSLAQVRAAELEESYDHVRPDGTRASVQYNCAEIINRRANTATVAVSSWMASAGHKDIILTEKYSSAGIGCYEGSDGTVYWCMLFSK